MIKVLGFCFWNFPHLLEIHTKVFMGEKIWYQRFALKYSRSGVPGWLSWLRVWLLISSHVMISQFVGSSSMLTAWSLLGILSSSLFPFPIYVCVCVCVCLCVHAYTHSLSKSINFKILQVKPYTKINLNHRPKCKNLKL